MTEPEIEALRDLNRNLERLGNVGFVLAELSKNVAALTDVLKDLQKSGLPSSPRGQS
jgi:hypothetical protein